MMSTPWLNHFQTLARYNAWATERLLNAIDQMTEQDYRRDVGLFFKSVHGTLNHLVVGEHLLWFRRFNDGVSPTVPLDSQMHEGRVEVAQALREGALRWEPAMRDWPQGRWDGVLNYTTMRGTQASLPFVSTLAHVFNHATHHRGQITAALTHMGYDCPELDMVYFLQSEQVGKV